MNETVDLDAIVAAAIEEQLRLPASQRNRIIRSRSESACVHRGDVIAEVPSDHVTCGCGKRVLRFLKCSKFSEPVLRWNVKLNGESSDEFTRIAANHAPGYKGRTCQGCSARESIKGEERFDVRRYLSAIPYHKTSSSIASVTSYFNPQKSVARRKCFEQFRRQFPSIGMNLYVAEGSVDGRWECPGSMRLDLASTMFAKENLLNLMIERLPDSVDSVLWIDGDVVLLDGNYRDKLEGELSKHRIVQGFASLKYIDNQGRSETGCRQSIAKHNRDNGTNIANPSNAYPGLAWAADRQLLHEVGGLYDRCVTGGGDIAFASAAYNDCNVPYLRYWPKSLVDDVLAYVARFEGLSDSVGVVESKGIHLYHGRLANRKYVQRNKVLSELAFDPNRHLEYAVNGTLKWSSCAPQELRDGIHAYMHGRKEDE